MINTRNVVSSTTLVSASVVCLATLFLGIGNVVEGSVEDVLVSIVKILKLLCKMKDPLIIFMFNTHLVIII